MSEKLRQLRDERSHLERQRAMLTQRSLRTLDVTKAAEQTMADLEQMGTLLAKASFREQKVFVRTFIGSYTIYADHQEAVVGCYRIPRHERITELQAILPNDPCGVPAPFSL